MLYGGIGGLLLLILNIYVIVQIFSSRMEPGMKLIWAIVVWVLPFLGSILYLALGPKNA